MPVIEKEVKIDEELLKKRHSLSHIMAEAVQKLYPNAKLGIGPAIDNGFYYDFDIETSISTKDLKKIQKEMKKIISRKLAFECKELSIEEAKKIFKEMGENYKIELIEELKEKGEDKVSLYYTGEGAWFDLCKGPHIEDTSKVNIAGFQLDRVSGAYWRGDEKNIMMQRIYGIYFDTKEELDKYLKWREDAKKRDHRKLGKELGLYMISEVVGKGLPMLLPKGATIKRLLERWTVDEEIKKGYEHVYTPVLGSINLYKMSGHWDHYKDSMYNPVDIDGELFILRPMTCPHHFMMYKNETHSYRDLPKRYAEISPLYRYEKSGELTGLIRLRNFTLADAHLICTKEQYKEEFKTALKLVQDMNETLGLDNKMWYRASIKGEEEDEKFIEDTSWDEAESAMLEILEELNLPYVIAKGEAAFYGPKVDVQMTNVHGKEDTVNTIQIDFVLAEKFDLNYIDNTGKEVRPVIVHRSSIGCFERTMAFLIEYYAGKFPLWLSPVQVEFVSISEHHYDYVKKIMDKFKENDIRVDTNWKAETFSKKLRQARLNLVPYIAIVGDKEMEAGQLSLRNRDTQKQTAYSVEDAIKLLIETINNKSLQLSL